jgi:predicted nucleotide-binding protein
LELFDETDGPPRAAEATPAVRNAREIFVVHGHDDGVKESVARFAEKLKLTPIILHEQADKGRTVIEKFLDHSKVEYAVVLLTPDDVGGPKDSAERNPRARQNVILELGYFIGALGRRRVCALKGPGVEVPSDLAGVLYVDLDAAGAWQLRLAREMKEAGMDIDLNLAI